ncbi:MAG: alanyl-tRNA editing protein [Dehalococcoidia bacterium]|jgi:misacylated tRNA(Ala) deacylase|nr:Ala-tRNA(Pro) hydrolase [Chloroflexota bacterium]RZP12712.1 MAG: alanyl-tRNA editing protein [Chloroflexota bacterium]|tara:strand:+ start:1290 stop:2003 length:714 start_codon:yes stop_codon:yes gene_type:complete
MTEQIYNSDAYIKELESKIIEVNMDHIVLDKTIFFPGGGGQPNDLGSIYLKDKEFKLEKISWKDGKIAHFLNDNNLNVGDLIVCKLDWSRRFKLMRTHTAMHILCGVIWRDYQAAVTGGNMEPLKGRMDFEFPSLSAELTEEIEQKLNIEVQKNRKITVDFLPREEAFKIPDLIRTKVNLLPESLKIIRTINIHGLDLQADGGTHVSSTLKVGKIKITGHQSKGKINKRIRIAVLDN